MDGEQKHWPLEEGISITTLLSTHEVTFIEADVLTHDTFPWIEPDIMETKMTFREMKQIIKQTKIIISQTISNNSGYQVPSI